MQVGALSFQPYIYNTNQVSAASMNKVKAISDDLTSKKTDYSGMVGEEENTNPLRKGESSDFDGIISKQMEMSRRNADRIMKPAEEINIVQENNPAIDSQTDVVNQTPADQATTVAASEESTGLENFSLPMSQEDMLDAIDSIDLPEGDEATMTELSDSQAPAAINGTDAISVPSEAEAMSGSNDDSQPGNSGNFLNEMFNRFQMRRAAEAYSFSMAM